MATVSSGTAPVREWNFILLKMAGTGLAGDIRTGLERLDKAGTPPDAYVTVRAEQNGKLTDYVVDGTRNAAGGFLQPMAGGLQARNVRQTPMMREDDIRTFLQDAMARYPAKHYYVAFEGHSHDIRHAMVDVHQALSDAVKARGAKIDLLTFDACFLAQIESAAEFQDVADTLLASEETMAGWRPAEEAAAALGKGPMTPKQMASFFVQRSQEFTLSALDLSQTPQVMAQARLLSDAILAVQDHRSIDAIRSEIARSQHFFTDGVNRPDTFHNTVDVFDCMDGLAADPWLGSHEPGLVAAARGLRDAVRPDPNGFVFDEKHAAQPTRDALVEITDVRRAHGASMYLPHTAPVLRDSYIHFPHSRFNAQTGFDAAIAHLTDERSPGYVVGSAAENAEGMALQGVRSAAEGVEMAAEKVLPHKPNKPSPSR